MSDWRPSAERFALEARASLYQHIREFFRQRAVLEVETPALARHGVTDPHIQCIAVPGYGYLQSSPEYHMKRLLAAGSGAIFQISRVFRDGEQGARHNPEFSMLEWYRPDFSLQALIDECVALLQPLLAVDGVRQYRFRQLFIDTLDIDPLTASAHTLRTIARQHAELPELDKAQLVDWLMATQVEPALPRTQLSVVTDFPEWAAALATLREDDDGTRVAQRFELYAGGLELANGYFELTDAAIQRQRFAQDTATRQLHNKPAMNVDEYLLDALQAGMPACSGVAIGLDRLLMVITNAGEITQVLTFPSDRA